LKAVPRGETVIRAPADSCAERNAGAEELEELARDLYGICKGDMLYFTYNKIPHASGRMRKSELQRKNY